MRDRVNLYNYWRRELDAVVTDPPYPNKAPVVFGNE